MGGGGGVEVPDQTYLKGKECAFKTLVQKKYSTDI